MLDKIKNNISSNKVLFLILKTFLFILLLLFIIIPYFEIRLLLLILSSFLILLLLPDILNINKIFLPLLIIILYLFSYFVLPYWVFKNIIISFIICLSGLLILIFILINKSSPIILKNEHKKFLQIFCILLIAAVIYNYFPLTNSLPFKGDNDYHLIKTNMIINLIIGYKIPFVLIIIGFILSFICILSKRKLFIPFIIITFIISGIYIYIQQRNNIRFNWIRRYPILFYYFNGIFSFPSIDGIINKFFPFFKVFYYDGNYRILSLISITSIAGISGLWIKDKNIIIKILFGISILSIPILYYYSSLTYIEIPVFVLILLSFLTFEKGLNEYIENNKISLYLLFLTAALFFKETLIIYAVIFITTVTILITIKDKSKFIIKIKKIFVYFLLITIPLIIFMYFRKSETRGYNFNLNHYFFLNNYKIIFIALWRQYSIMFPLCFISLTVMIIKKKYTMFWLSLSSIVLYLAFFMGDQSIVSNTEYKGTRYFCHARFNLYIMPPILYLIIYIFNETILYIKNKNLTYRYLILIPIIILITVNILLSPINILNGYRKPFWGDYTFHTAELDYPYNSLYKWMKNQKNYKKVLIIGRRNLYKDKLYHKKYNLTFEVFDAPKSEYDKYDFKNYDLIIFHQGEHYDYTSIEKEVRNLKKIITFKRYTNMLSVYKNLNNN